MSSMMEVRKHAVACAFCLKYSFSNLHEFKLLLKKIYYYCIDNYIYIQQKANRSTHEYIIAFKHTDHRLQVFACIVI